MTVVDRPDDSMQRIAAVARVLRDWDPLGVRPGVEASEDEYDGYAPSLTQQALAGAGVEALAASLRELREQMLGDPLDHDERSIAARIIAAAANPPERVLGDKATKRRAAAVDEGSYTCPSCGEQIVVPLDPSEGLEQRYVEDCPVCCRANEIRVEYFEDGDAPRVSVEPE